MNLLNFLICDHLHVFNNLSDPYKILIYYINSYNIFFKRFLGNIEDQTDLDEESIRYMLEQSRLDGIQRSFIELDTKSKIPKFALIDIFRAYDSNGYFQKIPSSMNRNFMFSANQTCNYNSQVYDSRCRSWYVNSKQSFGIILDPSQKYNTTEISYYGTGVCSQILDREKGFLGSVCGRLNLQSFNDIMYNVSTANSIFFTIHKDTRQVALFFKNNRTFTQFNINDQNENPYYFLVPSNITMLIQNLQQNYSSYNFASDQNLIVVQLDKGYTAIVSPVTIIDKIYYTNYISNLTLQGQIPLSDQYRYFEVNTPNTLNNPLFIFQVLSKADVLKSYNILTDFIQKLQITFIILIVISSLVGTIFIYFYSCKISYRLHSPIDKFLILFSSIKAQDLLYIEIFQESESKSLKDADHSSQNGSSFSYYGQQMLAEESDDSLEHFLTSKDTITLYNSFRSMFQMVRYSNYEYYKINYGKSLLQWIKACSFFKKQNDKRAIGICYMNIGNIHFNSERYQEALEAYEQAIIMANYELGVYDEIVDKIPQQKEQKEENQNILLQIQKKEIKKLKFDRTWSYSKALQMYSQQSSNSQCWQDYIQVMKGLLKTAKRLKLKNTIRAILQIELSKGKMMFNQLKQAYKLIIKTSQLIKQIYVSQNNQSATNLHTLSNGYTPNNRKQSAQYSVPNNYKRQTSLKNISKQGPTNQIMQINETSSQIIHQANQGTKQIMDNRFVISKKIVKVIREKIINLKSKALQKVSTKLFSSKNQEQQQQQLRIPNKNISSQNFLAPPNSQYSQSYQTSLNANLQTKNQFNNMVEQDDKFNKLLQGSAKQIQSSERIIENENIFSDCRIARKSGNSFFAQAVEQENISKCKQDVNQISQLKQTSNNSISQLQGDITSLGNVNTYKNNQDSFRNQYLSQRDTLLQAPSQNHLLLSTGRNDFFKNQQICHAQSFENRTSIMFQRQFNEETIKNINHDNTLNLNHTNNFQIKSDQMLVEKDVSAQEDSFQQIPQQNQNHQQNRQTKHIDDFKEQSEYNLMNNDSINQFYQLMKRDEYEYNIPLDILQSFAINQEALLLIKKEQFYDAGEILTQLFEDYQIYFPYFRYQTMGLLEQCFQSQNIISKEFEELKKILNSNIYFDVSIIIDIYRREQIEVVQELTDIIFEDITSSKFDKISVSIITEILEQVLAPINKQSLNFSQIRWIKLQLKLLIEDYRQAFHQRPSLLFSIFSLIEQIIPFQFLCQNKQVCEKIGEQNDALVYKKFILCITEIDLWEDLQINELLKNILNYYNIELLILDINSDKIERMNLFEKNNKSIIKLFKNVIHLCSYLSNMRLCTQSYGVPLIVERFQSGFLFSREIKSLKKVESFFLIPLLLYIYFSLFKIILKFFFSSYYFYQLIRKFQYKIQYFKLNFIKIVIYDIKKIIMFKIFKNLRKILRQIILLLFNIQIINSILILLLGFNFLKIANNISHNSNKSQKFSIQKQFLIYYNFYSNSLLYLCLMNLNNFFWNIICLHTQFIINSQLEYQKIHIQQIKIQKQTIKKIKNSQMNF
ncbi:tetratricopeptide repeat protein (macronuclear) [Tetrahymena thermophila SB210]|uniref:Tetratricopeptide repeat protein n=1 Tax=Tetrahymena thermophila (strain SB210) TaxID=312017 RepID=I7M7E2_TETTS|nr:tetratricopeptide repeat protein [Tetrahymena thermophila SB210]EAR92837.2 tetratricopeptide repeat protein [Tetrahymena thermophila SB210]|eukprot:XP_001013082.2 tetratricopeptide repeat protein [Tetrahymena thermophila SB210]